MILIKLLMVVCTITIIAENTMRKLCFKYFWKLRLLIVRVIIVIIIIIIIIILIIIIIIIV